MASVKEVGAVVMPSAGFDAALEFFNDSLDARNILLRIDHSLHVVANARVNILALLTLAHLEANVLPQAVRLVPRHD